MTETIRRAIYGSGGLGRSINELGQSAGGEIVGFVDDYVQGFVDQLPILGKGHELERIAKEYDLQQVIIALGDGYARERWNAFEGLIAADLVASPIVHPRAAIATSATIGYGSVVFAGTVIGSRVCVGRNCTLFSNCVLEHDDWLGDNVHLSPGVNLSGYVRVGAQSFLGTGAVVCPEVQIGQNVTVGAGAVVLHAVEDNIVVAGVPARVIRHKDGPRYY